MCRDPTYWKGPQVIERDLEDSKANYLGVLSFADSQDISHILL